MGIHLKAFPSAWRIWPASVFTNDLDTYNKSIDDDLRNNKNIVIVTMSAPKAREYEAIYKAKHNCKMHCSDNGNDDTTFLADVKKYWTQY